METLTEQLRRREADAEKDAHSLKALTAQLAYAEQEKTSLEQRARAAAEEHRGDRGRWFVHKQVCWPVFVCFVAFVLHFLLLLLMLVLLLAHK